MGRSSRPLCLTRTLKVADRKHHQSRSPGDALDTHAIDAAQDEKRLRIHAYSQLLRRYVRSESAWAIRHSERFDERVAFARSPQRNLKPSLKRSRLTSRREQPDC